MVDIIIVGFGGHGKSVADCIERTKEYKIVGYTDIKPVSSEYNYLGTDDVLQYYFEKGIRYVAIGIGYMGKERIRERLYEKLKAIGYTLPVIKDPTSIISNSAFIGEGTFIGKGAIINANSSVGKMVIINTRAVVEHECIVDDYSHISVATVLCGNVNVGKYAFVGANSVVIQGRTISENTIVPAGTTIR